MNQAEVDFKFKARYYKLGERTSSTKQIWWVFHGYGQLAQFFIQKFQCLIEQEIYVIAPEGLSRFYLDGNSGRVGATWMTRENRLMDIENYIQYLETILKIEPSADIQITLFGFSQGAATASRWALSGKIKFDRIILWSGLFPPDMDFEKGSHLLKEKKVIEVLGKNDPFITPARIEEMKSLNQQFKINPTFIEFEGKHEITERILQEIAFG